MGHRARGFNRVDCGSVEALLAEGRAVVRYGDIDVVVVRTGKALFAFEDRCPHLGRPMTQALVTGKCVVCHRHGQRFDLVSGNRVGNGRGPQSQLRVFVAEIEDGRLWLSTPNQPMTGAARPPAGKQDGWIRKGSVRLDRDSR